MIKTLISTSRGWLIRQGLKQAGVISATISSSIITKQAAIGLSDENILSITEIISKSTEGIIVGVISIFILMVEAYLSKKASPIATKE